MTHEYCNALNNKDIIAVTRMREGFKEGDPLLENLKKAINLTSSLPKCTAVGSSIQSESFCLISIHLLDQSNNTPREGTIYALPDGTFRYAEGLIPHEGIGLGWMVGLLTVEDSSMRNSIVKKLQMFNLPVHDDIQSDNTQIIFLIVNTIINHLENIDFLSDGLTPPSEMSEIDLAKLKLGLRENIKLGLDHAKELNKRNKSKELVGK